MFRVSHADLHLENRMTILTAYWLCFLAVMRSPRPRRTFTIVFLALSAPMWIYFPHVTTTSIERVAESWNSGFSPFSEPNHQAWLALQKFLSAIAIAIASLFVAIIEGARCTEGDDQISVYKLHQEVLEARQKRNT